MPNTAGVGVAAIDVPDPIAGDDLGGGLECDIADFHRRAIIAGRTPLVAKWMPHAIIIATPFHQVARAIRRPAVLQHGGGAGDEITRIAVVRRAFKNLLVALVIVTRPIGGGDENIVRAILASEAVPIPEVRIDILAVVGIELQGESNLLFV